MDIKTILKTINASTGRRFNTKTIDQAIDALEIEDPGLGDLEAIAKWCEENRPASGQGAGRNSKRKEERAFARKLLIENWRGFFDAEGYPTSADDEVRVEAMNSVGRAIWKAYVKMLPADCATITEDDGTVYLAVGQAPQKGRSRVKHYAKLDKKGDPTKASSKRTAMNIEDLTDEAFKRLLPRRQAWRDLAREAFQQTA